MRDRTTYDRRMQVKQYVGEVEGQWCRFRVFETGDPMFYLFDQLDPAGCSTTLQFPVRKTELRDDIRAGLRHGMTHRRVSA